jgi:predicted transcriptional regulator
MCNFILDIVVRFRPTRYVAPRSTQHDLSDFQRALLDILGHRGPLWLSDIEETLDTDASTRTVQRQLKTLRELNLVELEGHGRGARWHVASRSGTTQ